MSGRRFLVCWGLYLSVCGDFGVRGGDTERAMAAAEEEHGGPEGPNCERGGAGATFECNICLETAREAVISMCGHLYW